MTRPHDAYLASLEACVPALDAAGIEHAAVFEVGCPYISGARATLLRKALVWGADTIVFIDHDVSWAPADLTKLASTAGDVVGGTYRYKTDDERYMAHIDVDERARPLVRADGALRAQRLPAGFLKVTCAAVDRFMRHYPHLTIRDADGFESPDLFNHGAHRGTWFGEDYAFCRNWLDADGELWLVPDLELGHHAGDRSYLGNFHRFLLRQPGGSDSACPAPPAH